jgi:ankyrin repeat protein
MIRLCAEQTAAVHFILHDFAQRSALKCAAKNGDSHAVQILLSNGAEIMWRDKDGPTAQHWAARNGREAAVEYLVRAGTMVDANDYHGRTPLHLAAKRA